MNRKTVKKIFTLVVCALFIAATLLSAAFVLTHTHHEHDHNGFGENCAVCAHLTAAGNLLKLIVGALVCAVFGSGKFTAARSALNATCFYAVSFTLVRQKIQLNN